MKHHLERKISLSTESEFKTLYNWSLQETDDDGKKVGRDLIPWGWTLTFTATEISLVGSLSIRPPHRRDGASGSNEVRDGESIRAKLRPGDVRGGGGWHEPSYSMFGTKRTITEFTLFIEKLATEDEQERCEAWGAVSYTIDHDFRDETSDDTVTFHLYVRPDRFDRYAADVRAGRVDEAVLQLGGVSGFYSDWSPSISTNYIKVLTDYEKEHSVSIPEACEISPPRLGKIDKAELWMRKVNKLDVSAMDRSSDDGWVDEPVAVAQTNKARPRLSGSTDGLLASLRLGVWVVAGLLTLLLFK